MIDEFYVTGILLKLQTYNSIFIEIRFIHWFN